MNEHGVVTFYYLTGIVDRKLRVKSRCKSILENVVTIKKRIPNEYI